MAELHEYVGNIHIHSCYSDGTGTVPQIIRSAQAAKLDYIIITDHSTLAGRQHQGWHDKLLVLVGEELGTRHGHYLGLGLSEPAPADAPQAMIDAVAGQGGVGIIAHPHDIKYGWPDWNVSGFDGFSLWNFSSQWRGALQSIWSWLYYSLFPYGAVTAPPQATRELWDSLLRSGRQVTAIGASDAHAFGYRPLGIPLVILPYRALFGAINTHVLLTEPLIGAAASDAKRLLDALRHGSCFVANHRQGKARGFRFWAEGSGQTWQMGETVPRVGALGLEAVLPDKGHIVLMRDGQEVRQVFGRSLTEKKPAPGAYRVEVYRDAKGKRGWIFSNAIMVKE